MAGKTERVSMVISISIISNVVMYCKICDVTSCLLVYFTGVSQDFVASVFTRLFSDDLEDEALSSTETSVELRLKRDSTRAETRFRLSPKRTSPFKSGWGVSSVNG